MATQPEIFLNVCVKDMPDSGRISLFGQDFPANFKGPIDVEHSVQDNELNLEIPERGVSLSGLGRVDDMETVLIRVCDDRVHVVPIYRSRELMLMSVCCHCDSTEACGPIGCSCFAESE